MPSRAKDVVKLEGSNGQVGPVDRLGEAHQLRHDGPDGGLGHGASPSVPGVGDALSESPGTRVVPVDEEDGSLAHEGPVERDEVRMVN